MLVKEIMSKNVITIRQDETILHACDIYKKYKVGCLIVTDADKKHVGIITERDIIERTICDQKDPATTPVSAIMTSNPKTVHSLDNLDKALEIMKTYDIKKLPVLYNGVIAGIITVTDISRARPELSKRFMDTWVKPSWKD